MRLEDKNMLVRLIVIVISFVAPFVYTLHRTDQASMSEFWSTHLQPLFIFVNAATSYYFFSTERWKPAAILLLLLTAFSVEDHFVLHNIFAITFFVYSIFPLMADKRLSLYIAPYFMSMTLIHWPDIFFAEFVAISTLSAFHFHKLCLLWAASKQRKKLLERINTN